MWLSRSLSRRREGDSGESWWFDAPGGSYDGLALFSEACRVRPWRAMATVKIGCVCMGMSALYFGGQDRCFAADNKAWRAPPKNLRNKKKP